VTDGKTLFLLNPVNRAVRVLMQQTFSIDGFSKLLNELLDFFRSLRIDKLGIFGFKLVSFEAFHKCFDLIDSLRRAQAAICNYLANFVL
jgi:hypothetical protein